MSYWDSVGVTGLFRGSLSCMLIDYRADFRKLAYVGIGTGEYVDKYSINVMLLDAPG